MADPLLRELTPAEYFKELVETAMTRQHVRATDDTAFYLVDLLCRFVRVDARSGDEREPLALRLGRALETGGLAQRARLRSLGDFSLFTSGFFSDSLQRGPVDVDYYVSMGEYAYGSLARRDEDAFCDVFRELSAHFVDFVDVLAEVNDHTSLASNVELLRLYEKWLRTGSTRDGQRLIERGILPNSSIGSRFVQ